jgi:hypothetical protein
VFLAFYPNPGGFNDSILPIIGSKKKREVEDSCSARYEAMCDMK